MHRTIGIAHATSLLACLALGLGGARPHANWLADGGSQGGPTTSTHVYKRVGACDIKADVHRPPSKEPRPAVMWIHGGALIFGNRGSIRPDQLQRYLDAGFVLVSIDYRLAPETKLPDIVGDVRDAYRWVRTRGPALAGIDPDRVALVGNSAGGYLALMAGGSVVPRPKAIVSFYGYGDLTRDWIVRANPRYLGLEPISKEEALEAVGEKALSESPVFPRVLFYNYAKQNGLWTRDVAAPPRGREREALEAFSPMRLITRNYPPTLLLHGDKDSDVPFEESELLAAALAQQGVPHRLVRMRDYDHLFDVFSKGWPASNEPIGLRDPQVAAAYDEVITFLTTYLGNRR